MSTNKTRIPPTDRNGYGNFKVQISEQLTLETTKKLAVFFEFPPADYDAIERSATPGLDFVVMIDAKDIITEECDEVITDALKRIGKCGIAQTVRRLFVENVRGAGTAHSADIDCGHLRATESDRSEFPGLEDDQFEHASREDLECLNRIAGRSLESKLRRYSLQREDGLRPPDGAGKGSGVLRVAVIGKIGQGKSASANSILGMGTFDEDNTATTVTNNPTRRSSLILSSSYDGRKIFVVDTPGLQETDRGNCILKDICNIPMLLDEGVHAFIYVVNSADPRFGLSDLAVLQSIKSAFEKDFTKYCLVLFTRAESTLKTASLEAFVAKQKEDAEFKSFLDQVDWRILALENSATSLTEKQRNQSSVISLVDEIISENKAEGRLPVYTTKMFEIVQKAKKRVKFCSSERGWGQEVYEAAEGASAALGNAQPDEEKLFQEMCVRLPFGYNEALKQRNLYELVFILQFISVLCVTSCLLFASGIILVKHKLVI